VRLTVQGCEARWGPHSRPAAHLTRTSQSIFGLWLLCRICPGGRLVSVKTRCLRYAQYGPERFACRPVVEVYGAPCFHGSAVHLPNGLPDRIRPSEPSSVGPAAGIRVSSRVLRTFRIFDAPEKERADDSVAKLPPTAPTRGEPLKMSRPVRREMEPGFGLCAKLAAEIRPRL
jgi:hypothetical protein